MMRIARSKAKRQPRVKQNLAAGLAPIALRVMLDDAAHLAEPDSEGPSRPDPASSVSPASPANPASPASGASGASPLPGFAATKPTGNADPLWFLFELGEDPIFDHPLWLEHANTVPCVRQDIRLLRESDGKFTWTPARGPEDIVASTMRLLYRLLDGFAPHMGQRGRDFRWYMQPAAFGGFYKPEEIRNFPLGVPLLGNPADALESGRRGPFTARGVELNRRIADEFLQGLAQNLRQQRLPDPLALILASENGPNDDFHGHTSPASAIRTVGDRGWYPEALEDPRAVDPNHTIDGRLTLAEYHAQARTLDGGPVPDYRDELRTAIPPGRHPVNAESSERYRGAMRRAWEWSRFRAFAEPALRAFATPGQNTARRPLVGEYLAGSDSAASPVLSRPMQFQHQMNGMWLCDLQCPGYYGGPPWLYPDAPLTNDHPGWDTLPNYQRELGITESDREKAEWRCGLEAAIRIARGHANAAPHAPLAPYIQTVPDRHRGLMLEYLRACRSLGAAAFNIFMPKTSRQEHDFWRSMIEELAND